MANTTFVAAACFVLGGLFGAVHRSQGKESEDGPGPLVLGIGEGEKLLMHDGRYVLLKTPSDDAGKTDLCMGSEILPPGTAIPIHCHDRHSEIIFIHEGIAQVTLGEEKVLAEAGTTIYIPPGTWHGVAAHGDESTTMLFIFPEPKMADFFRRVGFKEGESPTPLTAEDWTEILQQHQMRARDS